VYHSVSQSITNATETTLAFDSERWDTDTMHDTVTNNSRITFKTAGLYLLNFSFEFPTHGTGYRYGLIRINGSGNPVAFESKDSASVASGVGFAIASLYKFAVNDYVEARVYQTSGGALNVTAAAPYSAEFSAVWVGLG